MITGTFISEILVAFYLYLLVRPQHVKRTGVFWIGICAVLVGILAQFFGMGRKTVEVATVLEILTSLVAFAAAVLACYTGRLPITLSSGLDTVQPAAGEPEQTEE